MDANNNMINIRSSSQELDGRRPIAGGMPSYQEGEYEFWYNRAWTYYSKRYDWDSKRWKEEIDLCASSRAFGHEGYMACLWDMYHQQIDREYRAASVSFSRDRLQRELGAREFTLTYSPAWYADDASVQDAMRVAIDKLTRYYKHEIIEFHAIGEFTEAGRSHVHCYYELDGGVKITDKNFKRAWPHWNPRKTLGTGHQGGHHANIRSKSDFLGYIEKDLNTAWMNVHITRNANDDKEPNGSSSPSELSQPSGTEDKEDR